MLNRHLEDEIIWFEGDFEGELSGSPVRAAKMEADSHLYGMTVDKGVVRNVRRIAAPPVGDSPEGESPIQQFMVNDVLLEDADTASFVQFIVHDFRLHQWLQPTYKELSSKLGTVLIASIQGKAYFYLPIKKANVVAQTVNKDDPLNPMGTATADVRECFACNSFLRLGLLLVLCVLGDWPSSLLSGMLFFLVAWFACMLDRLVSPVFKLRRVPIQWLASIALLLLAASGLWNLYQLGDCSPDALNWLWWPAVALFLSCFVFSCWLKWPLVLIWFLAVLQVGALCGSSWWNDVHKQAEVAREMFTPDEVENQRLLIDEAESAPELILSGKNRIYGNNLFDHDKSLIKSDHEITLKKWVGFLKKYPDYRIKILGYTDQLGELSPEGRAHNYALSQQRAESVALWLKRHGLNNQIETSGMGSQALIYTGLDVAKFGKNRRVEVQMFNLVGKEQKTP